MSGFVHLHVHSEYSLLDGAARINDIVSYAKKIGQNAIAITDHGAMYGVLGFYKAAKKAGIKPILGVETYLVEDLAEKNSKQREYGHLLLLAKNEKGYKNLMRLCSIGFLEGFYYKPRIDYITLEKYADGLICTSACVAGDIPQMLLTGRADQAYALAARLKNMFGPDFYIEIQDHGLREEKRVTPLLIELAGKLGIGLVATNDTHYVEKGDARAQEVLMCLQMGRTLEEGGLFETDEFYIKTAEEMQALFSYVPEALANTQKIADQCDVEIELGKLHLPAYPVPAGYTDKEYLEHLVRKGMVERYGEDYTAYEARLCYEMNVINSMGFTDYFLIVWDYVDFARRNKIMVGPGRGSVAGSIVAYALKITEIDPIAYNLLFERFLNPERVSMPDIDIDFCIERRQEVIDYVAEKYGKDKVAQLITFGTLGAKQVVRDVARVMGIPVQEADRVAKMIPFAVKMTIARALEESPKLRVEYESDARIREWLDMAMKIEGMPRQSSTHAAAVVISVLPITEYSPLTLNKKDESVTTQYNMHDIEELGLLKMDFLGLRTLTVIRDAVAMVQKNRGISLDIGNLDMRDKAVYEMISAGETDGIFQLESDGMRSLMTKLRPENLGDIMVGISLFRPGPMAKIPDYIEGKNFPEKVHYDHPMLEGLLQDTYGCMVYQEQVMEIVRDMAGYSLARSDEVRRAMAKKKKEVMERERKIFIYGGDGIEGAVHRGVPEAVAQRVFDQMMDFAQYAFNKSHACAYAVVAYQTAYLKCHYKEEFMTALLNSFISNADKVAHYMRYIRRTGTDIRMPDINRSGQYFSVEGKSIRFGLSALVNVGESIDQVIVERQKGGAYEDFEDFIRRNVSNINKTQIESFILSGCFDYTGARRAQLMGVYENLYKNAQAEQKRASTGQISIFDLSGETVVKMRLPDIPEYEEKEKLALEKEKVGMYLSGHPLQKYAKALELEEWNLSKIQRLVEHQENLKELDGKNIELVGIFTQMKARTTRRSRQVMANGMFEDLTGSLGITIFPAVYAANEAELKTDTVCRIRARIAVGEEAEAELFLEDITPYTPSGKRNVGKQKLYIRMQNEDVFLARAIKDVLQKYPGENAVCVVVDDTGKRYGLHEKVFIGNALVHALKNLVGEGNVAIKA